MNSSRRTRNRTFALPRPVVVLLAAALGLAGCASAAGPRRPGGTATSTSTATSSPQPSGDSSSTASPSATASATRSTSSTQSGAGVRFDASVSSKAFGDPPFRVSATATGGGPVRYSASGSCRLSGTRTVTIVSVGTCTVRASATSPTGTSGTATLSVPVSKGHPVIRFSGRTTAFTRPFTLPLRATSSAGVRLTYRLLPGAPGTANDDGCVVRNGSLTLSPGFILPAVCMVEAAATSSPNYVTPAPVRALMTIGFSNLQVSAPPNTTVVWRTAADGQLAITIHEDSGDAFGMEVDSEDGPCEVGAVSPADPPAGTTRYVVNLTLPAPSGSGYTCDLRASATPEDYDGGISDAPFRVTVTLP